jgi:RNA polymerase primary sigma factor
MGGVSQQTFVELLFNIYKDKGFVSTDTVFEVLNSTDMSLDAVDRICDELLSMGVIIRDDPADFLVDDDDEYDRSQIDYEQIFNEVLSSDPALKHYIDDVRKIQPPQYREWQLLLPQAKSGNSYAFERLCQMYLRNVIRIALTTHKKYGVPLAETIQDGNVGLIMAIEKYDPISHDVFSTYFPWWVRQNITREMIFSPNPFFYFPVHIREQLYSIYELVLQYESNNHECFESVQGLVEQVAQMLNCPVENASKIIGNFHPVESIEVLLKSKPDTFSDNGFQTDEYLENNHSKDIEVIVRNVLQTLTSRECRVLELRYGILDGRERTLEEVGNEFGVTRERIRQIEAKAIRKLQHPSRSKKLKSFYD